MSSIAEEIASFIGSSKLSEEEFLAHYGIKRRSGRYPYGSGDDPYQHGRDFYGRVEELKKNGWEETPENIKKEFGMTTTQYRTEKRLAKNERRMLQVARAKSLQADGKGYTEIGREMGINESTVRSLLDEKSDVRMRRAQNTAEIIRAEIDKKGMVDVGVGVERELGVSKECLKESLYILEREGYPVYEGGMDQVTNRGQRINQKVICKPGTEHKEIYQLDKVHSLKDYTSHDDGETFDTVQYPKSMDSKRLKIRYAEEGGIDKDGIVEIRRGVDDLSLGDKKYAQVRILVDDTKYIKGMAVYSDDMPDGVDVVFNTNKKLGTEKLAVLKDIKSDPDNPFGSLIKANGQSYYVDKDGNRQLGVINRTRDEGDWEEWKDAVPSQFLSKQSLKLAEKQLNLAKDDKHAEYKEICDINNPTIKKYYLEKFADECDSSAKNLQAAALPGQKHQVIIPITSMKDDEVYAPRYEDGTKLALVRYPHGGTFEIPILTVNNKQETAKKLLGPDAKDAVGINSKVAERLSGADFDGDTVMCIPTHDGKTKIRSTPKLKELEGFDPKSAYPERPGMKYMKDPVTGKDSTQMEMGRISNLITDMTLAGASTEELARAVKHSMVVIDAGKHKLDYKKSEQDNDIASLQREYQRHVDKNGKVTYGGASTVISKAKGQETVERKQGSPYTNIKGKPNYDPTRPEGVKLYKKSDDLYYPERVEYNKETGDITYRTIDGKRLTYNVKDKDAVERYTPVKRKNEQTGEVTYTDKTGTIQYRVKAKHQQSTKMDEVDDAMDLVSEARHPMELLYADYANDMKSLARQARIEAANTGKIAYSKSAKDVYKDEVKSLDTKLDTALKNSPREREAQRRSNVEVDNKVLNDPSMKKKDIKKASQQAITKYRAEVGAVARRDRNIDITDKEWEAIQAGAISESTLLKILNNADTDKLRDRATPKSRSTLSPAKEAKIKRMQSSGYSLAEIAKACGCSTSTVSKYLKGGN